MFHTRKTFGEAKSLAGTLADTDGIKYCVLSNDGASYMIASEHTPWYQVAAAIDSDILVYVAYPGNNNEDIFRRALEQIAYNENWPKQMYGEEANPYINRLRHWMQSVAANALTNAIET